MNKNKFLLAIFLLIFPVNVYANTGIDTKEIENMSLEELMDIKVTTVSKYSQKISDAPATTIVITDEQIKARGYQDLKDVFYDLPGFDVSSNVAGEVRSLIIPRGLTGDNKVLVLQDGQRLNSPTGERFLFGNNLPVNMAKRIEIIYGPASAIYGADAFGAIVNIITKSAKDIDGLTLNANYGTQNTYTPSISFGKKIDDFEAVFFGRMFNSDGQKFASDYKELEPVTKYAKNGFTYAQPIFNYNLYGKLNYKDFSIFFDLNTAKEPNGESEIPNNYMYTKENVWGQRLGRVVAQYNTKFIENKLEGVSTFSNYIYEATPDTNFYIAQELDKDNVPKKASPEYKYAYSASQKLEQQINYYPSEYLNLIGGVSFENLLSFPKTQNIKTGQPFDTTNLVDDMSAFVDKNTGKVFGNISDKAFGVRPFQNYAGYLQAEVIPLDILRLTLGGRYDYSTLFAGTFNPRVGLVYKPLTNLDFKINYGTAYIQPSNYYRWENWANPFAMHVPNLDLKPEKVGSFNFNASYDLLKNVNLGLDLFRNDVSDIIKPVPIDQNTVFNPFLIVEKDKAYAETNKNQGKQYTQGAELKLTYSLGKQDFKGIDFGGLSYLSYSFIQGEDLANSASEKNSPIGKIANHKINFGADLNLWKFTISPRIRWASNLVKSPSNSTYKEGTEFPGYFLVNVNTRLNIINNLSAYLTVNNLLDTPYYAAAPFGESVWILPRAPQAKRTILFGLEYSL